MYTRKEKKALLFVRGDRDEGIDEVGGLATVTVCLMERREEKKRVGMYIYKKGKEAFYVTRLYDYQKGKDALILLSRLKKEKKILLPCI